MTGWTQTTKRIDEIHSDTQEFVERKPNYRSPKPQEIPHHLVTAIGLFFTTVARRGHHKL